MDLEETAERTPTVEAQCCIVIARNSDEQAAEIQQADGDTIIGRPRQSSVGRIRDADPSPSQMVATAAAFADRVPRSDSQREMIGH